MTAQTFPWFRYSLQQPGEYCVDWYCASRNRRGTVVFTPTTRKFETLEAAEIAARDVFPAHHSIIRKGRDTKPIARFER